MECPQEPDNSDRREEPSTKIGPQALRSPSPHTPAERNCSGSRRGGKLIMNRNGEREKRGDTKPSGKSGIAINRTT